MNKTFILYRNDFDDFIKYLKSKGVLHDFIYIKNNIKINEQFNPSNMLFIKIVGNDFDSWCCDNGCDDCARLNKFAKTFDKCSKGGEFFITRETKLKRILK